ncbi:hypothetical protein C9424_03520 [Arthrobacter sp. H-02-3]|nr:hypothetical protein C9424_03520 [Arthrobacter sp. H-02-3]
MFSAAGTFEATFPVAARRTGLGAGAPGAAGAFTGAASGALPRVLRAPPAALLAGPAGAFPGAAEAGRWFRVGLVADMDPLRKTAGVRYPVLKHAPGGAGPPDRQPHALSGIPDNPAFDAPARRPRPATLPAYPAKGLRSGA